MKLFRLFMQQQPHLSVIIAKKHNPSLHYTKIDRCQDNICIDDDVNYRQILHSNACLNYQRRAITVSTKTFASQIHLLALVLLLLTAQSGALPIIQQPLALPVQTYRPPTVPPSSSVYLPQNNLNAYRVYRRLPMPTVPQQLNRVPSYSNNAVVQISDQTNSLNVQQQQNEQQQFNLQLRRERQRRHMIDRMILSFDENADGQLTKDEFYTMALRVNIFPKFHSYLKQLST